jgi:hypothetical protein
MTIETGNAGPPARMRGLATKIQRQPFAPFQLNLSVQLLGVAGGTRAARAFALFESRIGDLRTC